MKAIFKLAFAFAALLSFAACSDVPMPYEQPGDNSKGDEPSTDTYLDESFSSDFGKFTNVTVKGNAWAIDYQTAKATGYDNNSKKTTESEAYLVSSPINLSKSTAAHLQFEYILRYVKEGQTENKVLITDNYTGDPTTTTWTDISGTMTEGSDWTTFSTYKKNIPTSFIGKSSVVVAMMYSCTTTSSTIEVKNLTLKEGTVDEGGNTPETPAEGEATGDGTKDHPYNSVAANKYTSSLASGAESDKDIYIKGKVVSVKEQYGTQFGNATFYISDDGKADNQFYVFRALYLNNEKYASGTTLNPGDEVVVCGKVTNYMGNTPETVQGKAYLVSLKSNGGGTTPDKPETGADISINASDFGLDDAKDMGEQTLSDGTTLTFDKGSNSNGPKYYKTAGGTIRMYPNNSVTINAGSKKVATIVLTCDSYNGTDYTAEGKLTSTSGKVNLSDLIYTISDINASSLTLTNSETGTGGKTQVRIKTITITYAK